MFVADLGLAYAFKDFGRNTGSRPYMAPEQFSATPIDPTEPPSFDVFALGVQDRTSTSEEIRTLTSEEVDAVAGGMLTQFTYGDTSIVI